MTPLLAGLLAAACVSVALLAVPMLLDRGPVDRLAARTGAETAGGRRRSLLRRLIERLAAAPRARGWRPGIRLSRREAIARRLDLAGRPGGLTVQRLHRAQGRAGAAGRRLLRLPRLIGGSWLIAFLAGGTRAGSCPTSALARRAAAPGADRARPPGLPRHPRGDRARRARLPLALQRVAESLGGPAGEEILIALRQMDLGATRRDAFLALRERNNSESLSTFIGAQLQAEELGVPLSEALNDIALDMRRSAAPERAPARRAGRAADLADRNDADRARLDHPHPRLDDPRHRHPRLRGPRRWLSGSSSAARAARAAGSSRPARASSPSAPGSCLITVVALLGEDGDRTLPAAAIVVAAITSAIPLRYWDRVGPALVRHPGYLAGELVLATLILLLTGVNSPFFYYTLGTALLGGLRVRLARRGAVLGDADRRLLLGRVGARRDGAATLRAAGAATR